MRTRWRRQEVKRGQYQRFKNVKGSVLFQRCFKERIWAFFINYQRSQREGATGLLHRLEGTKVSTSAMEKRRTTTKRNPQRGWAFPFHSRSCSWKYEHEKYIGSDSVGLGPAFPRVPIPLEGGPNFHRPLGGGPSTPRAPLLTSPAPQPPPLSRPGPYLPTAGPGCRG